MFDLYCCPYSFQFHSYHRRHYTSNQRVGYVLRTFIAEEYSVLVCVYTDRHTSFVSLSFLAAYVYVLPSSTIILYIIYVQQTWSNGPLAYTARGPLPPWLLVPPLRKHRSYIKALPNFPSLVLHILCIYTTYIYIHEHFISYIYVFVSVCLIYGKLILHALFLRFTVPVCHPDFGHIRRFMIIFSLFNAAWGGAIKGWGVWRDREQLILLCVLCV